MAAVAQLVRASGCDPEGCEFESRLSPLLNNDWSLYWVTEVH